MTNTKEVDVAFDTFSQGDSLIHRIDPRARIVSAFIFSFLIAFSENFITLLVGIGLAIFSVIVARLPLKPFLKRLAIVNLFIILIWLVLPFSTEGRPLFTMGHCHYTFEGVLKSGKITLRCNTIVIVLISLLSTIEITALGHAFSHLKIPDKLTHLFLFTIRYIHLLQQEYKRLQNAMKVRCFRTKMNRHTYRSLGYLIGMLLVRSVVRSERVYGAMKCRGFQGKFWVLSHFSFRRRDIVFAVTTFIILICLFWIECLQQFSFIMR